MFSTGIMFVTNVAKCRPVVIDFKRTGSHVNNYKLSVHVVKGKHNYPHTFKNEVCYVKSETSLFCRVETVNKTCEGICFGEFKSLSSGLRARSYFDDILES
jgi:hypothetical protein